MKGVFWPPGRDYVLISLFTFALKREWVLNQESFNKLLALFDSDIERAAEKYEYLRATLIKLFECRGCHSPCDLADEVINRVARQLEEGKDIRPPSLVNYFYGVARNVLREHKRHPESTMATLDALAPAEHPAEDPATLFDQLSARYKCEQRLECIETCVAGFPPETRRLILSYYEGEEGIKIENRKRLAESLGIPINTLRIRVHRIRDRLEKCVADCLGRADE